MVDFGGVNIPELSQNTKDGILDPSSLRRVPASITNPLATISEGGNPVLTMIVKGKFTGGFTDFFSTPAGLTLRLLASVSVPFQYLVNGLLKTLQANVDLTLTNNAHNFVWVDGSGALGSSPFPCYYGPLPPALVDGTHWFDLSQGQMKVYDGFAVQWVNVDRVFIGYARASGGAILTPTVCELIGLTPMDRWRRFGTGENGFLSVGSGTTTIDGEKNYAAVVVYGTGVVKHTANPTKQLHIKSQGVIVALETGGFSLDGLGALMGAIGGLGGAGGGGGHGGTVAVDGGGHLAPPPFTYKGGGPKSNVDNVTAGAGEASAVPIGLEAGLEPWPTFLFGIGAGGGDGGGGAPQGLGGPGGGSVLLRAPYIAFASTATITSKGTDGTPGGAVDRGGGGGGGGGVIAIYAYEYKNTGSDPVVSAGAGAGEGGGSGSSGGDGGAGAWFWRYPAA